MYRIMMFAIFVACAGVAGPVAAQVQQGDIWSVSPDFEGKRARLEISGAVCAGSETNKAWCLAVNDETKYAQFFSIRGNSINPLKRIKLLAKFGDGEKADEIDAEGAAYDNGFVYVIGSHGLSRRKAKFRRSQFLVFRFPVDRKTGKPTFAISPKHVAPEIERSGKLREVIHRSAEVGPFAEQPLGSNGANIEGMTVINGRMYFGFRGPSVDQTAFIIEVSSESIFGDAKSEPATHVLKLGAGVGIRDLAKVTGGLLVLTGHVNDRQLAPEIYFWNPGSGRLDHLARLAIVPKAKAETLLVLDELADGAKHTYRLLILYDSLENGRPTEHTISRQLN